jgi:hypothetical protein
MPEFYEQVYKAQTPADAFDVAAMWLSRGWKVLPVQPGTKRLVRGFGPMAGAIELPEVAYYWFFQRKANLAVVCPPGAIVLDFDQIGYFESFLAGRPDLAKSYSESTPRGGAHLFLNLEDGRALEVPGLIRGVEVKRFCLAYPSKLPAGNYEVVQPGPILCAPTELIRKALEPFFVLGDKCPPKPASPVLSIPRASQGDKFGLRQNRGVLARVKAAWPILSYLAYFEPGLILEGRGEWREGLCPWHSDHHASLRVNTVTNTWRCFACESFGDVVNWHARRLGVTDQGEAARDLDKYKLKVGI